VLISGENKEVGMVDDNENEQHDGTAENYCLTEHQYIENNRYFIIT